MGNQLVNIRDQKFVIFEQLKIDNVFKNSKFSEYSIEVMEMVLNEAEKMAIEVILPTHKIGDREGCTFKNGQVYVPDSYHNAYRTFSEAGWASACAPPHAGGQGMPMTLHKACCELFGAANYPFCLYHWAYAGAATIINIHGTENQKQKFMYKMFAGEWGGTQCMTEPNAGTDAGAIRTTARRLEDGNYSITGTKIFISEGDHNFTSNIVHTVLARVKGDPPGTKGLSMFLVPKYRVNEDGSIGETNDVKTLRIEEKMGFHANATCMLSFGEDGKCIGELLGEERAGMKIMFQFINEERLYAGIHGLSQASASYEHSVQYSKERIQGSLVSKKRQIEAPTVAIIEHPDIRRMLMHMKAHVEGIRALNYFTAFGIDKIVISEEENKRQKWQGLVDLLIPICKAYSSDKAVEICSMAMDVHGGYGYCKDFPVEQYLRDAKIACIYEGTNGIQAFDLVWRKLDQNDGKSLSTLYEFIMNTLGDLKEEELQVYIDFLEEACNFTIELSKQMRTWKKGPDYLIPVLYAKPYLTILGDLIVGWLLMDGAGIAHKQLRKIYSESDFGVSNQSQSELAKQNNEVAFYQGKIASAKYFAINVLATIKARCELILIEDQTPLEVSVECFG